MTAGAENFRHCWDFSCVFNPSVWACPVHLGLFPNLLIQNLAYLVSFYTMAGTLCVLKRSGVNNIESIFLNWNFKKVRVTLIYILIDINFISVWIYTIYTCVCIERVCIKYLSHCVLLSAIRYYTERWEYKLLLYIEYRKHIYAYLAQQFIALKRESLEFNFKN